MTPAHSSTSDRPSRQPTPRGFSLLLVLFVLTLVGATLLAIGAHFHFTVKHAQTGRMEAQAAQILHSGLDWARLNPLQPPTTPDPAPILLDASPLAGPNAHAKLEFSWNATRKTWQMTVSIDRGPRRITQTMSLPPQSPESNRPDSR